MADTIIIIGAGIIGLNTAFILVKQGLGPYITVVAEYLPGDTSIAYTSPWAGGNFSAISGADDNALRWDEKGYKHLKQLNSEFGEAAFVGQTTILEYWDDAPHSKIESLSKYLDEYRTLPPEQLPEGVSMGIAYKTIIVNAPKHLEFLYEKLKSDFGIRFVRRKLGSLDEAYESPKTQVVFNCIGNAARTLPGVQDLKSYPTRGQIVLVKAPKLVTSVMRHGKDYETYIIPRPNSNGNVVLGGYMQKGVDDQATYAHETQSILDRTSKLSAEWADGTVEVLGQFSGLRPSREGGARVERGELTVKGRQRVVVHNYGAGGTGYQAGYGMAEDAVELAKDILDRIRGGNSKL